jgi:phosphoketolase
VVRGRRRRRGRDRPAGHRLALQQVPQPDPRRRGAADPHLNGYKINNPTCSRASPRGTGRPVEGLRLGAALRRGRRSHGDAPAAMAATMDACVMPSRNSDEAEPAARQRPPPRWPMIVLRTPKGWTGPEEVDGHKVEGFWRAHQVPLSGMHNNPSTWRSSSLDEELQARGAVRRHRYPDRPSSAPAAPPATCA